MRVCTSSRPCLTCILGLQRIVEGRRGVHSCWLRRTDGACRWSAACKFPCRAPVTHAPVDWPAQALLFESLSRAVMHHHTMVHLVTAFLSPQPHGPSSIPPANLPTLPPTRNERDGGGGGSLPTWPFCNTPKDILLKPLQLTRRSEDIPLLRCHAGAPP
ncbi:hypothetical protein LX32DRAFT_228553 [Colletotrichum zoysiae]|uniref:Uncharacterized protein n=1 Tax=Colletotrichum zoysiae TaxID=1216348 RepID=A0AAD9HNG6_9PEZI|nr:hypothetical protein LX32DRAFT_228553 [Colletotrichum zoysiae]